MDGDSTDHRPPGEHGRGVAQPGNQEQPTTNDLKRAGQVAEPIAEPDLRKQLHPERIRGELRSADPDKHATRGNAQHQAEDIERLELLGRRQQRPFDDRHAPLLLQYSIKQIVPTTSGRPDDEDHAGADGRGTAIAESTMTKPSDTSM